MRNFTFAPSPTTPKLRAFLWLLVLIQFVGCFGFISRVFVPVADEATHAEDLFRYFDSGVTKKTLHDHANPATPGPYIWSGILARPLGRNWTALRSTLMLAWVITLFILLAIGRRGPPEIKYAAAFFFLNPFFPVCAGKWMTEGPGMMVFFTALYFFLESFRSHENPRKNLALILAASLFFGLAIWFKQFFLAAAPTACLIYLVQKRDLKRAILVGIGPALAVFSLWLIWGGITSPLSRVGDALHDQAKVGFNFDRFWDSALFFGLYSIPFLPWYRRDLLGAKPLTKTLAISAVATAIVTASKGLILGNGPLLTVLKFLDGHLPWSLAIGGFISTTVGIAVFFLFLRTVFLEAQSVFSDPLEGCAVLFTLFYIAENMFAAGSIVYYERYNFNLVFFSTYFWARRATPSSDVTVATALIWTATAQGMLWRYAMA